MLSLEQLYGRYADDVYRFAFWLSGNAVDADDITSETFVRAWAGSAKIRTETVKAYLFTIARNLYLKQQRDNRTVDLEDWQWDNLPLPEAVVAERWQLTAVLRTLHTFPEMDRTVLILRVQYELPYAEIARILGISLASAKVKVHRTRLKLAAIHSQLEET